MSLSAPVQGAFANFGSVVDFGLAGDFFFTDQSANNGQGYVNLLVQNTWSDSQIWVDVGAGGLVGETASSYIKAPQMFYRHGSENGFHITVGRARHNWSSLDEFWQMGHVQPVFLWNEAVPEQQGLTGLFVNAPVSKDFAFTLFASPLFIPTQGPTFEINNGRLTSSNPWFNQPVQVINFSGQQAELNYGIDVPRIQDIVLQPSFGGRFGTEPNKKDFLFNTFYMNKPRNTLMLPFEGALNLSTFNGDISVRPQVARHEVMGIDLGWNFHRAKTEVSWLRESSAYYQAHVDTTFPVVPEQNIFSFQQLYRITPSQRIVAGYINVDRGPTSIGGVFADADVTTFDQRNRFEHALRLEWQGLLLKTLSQYHIRTTLAYYQSLINDNMWLSADVNWSIHKGLEMFTRCDFFGGSNQQIRSLDFISTFQNNDRCLVGGHYAF